MQFVPNILRILNLQTFLDMLDEKHVKISETYSVIMTNLKEITDLLYKEEKEFLPKIMILLKDLVNIVYGFKVSTLLF